MQTPIPDLMPDFTPLHDPARLAALRRTLSETQDARGAFDRLARIAATALHAPVALVSLVTAESQVFVGGIGLPQPLEAVRETPLARSFCQYAVITEEPFVVADARMHPLVQNNPVVEEAGVVAYAGIPLITVDGQALGSFCVIDHQPREWTAAEIALLTDLAGDVMTEIELRATVAERERALALARAAHAEAEVARAEAAAERGRLRALFTQAPAIIALFDGPEQVFAFVNPVFAQVAGRAASALVGRPIAAVFPGPAGQSVARLLNGVYTSGTPFAGTELSMMYDRHGNGTLTEGQFDVVIEPTFDGAGVVTGVFMFGTEVTARVEARKQDALARAFMEYGHDFITVTDADGVYRYVSPSHERVLGIPVNQMVGRRAFDAAPPEERAAVEAWYADVLAAPGIPQTLEMVLPGADGALHTFESTVINRLNDPDIRGVIGTSRDVTERKATLAALHESEQRLQTTIANAPVVLFAIDTAGMFTFAAGQGLQTIGLQPDDLVGHNSFKLYREMPQLVEQMRRALAGEQTMALMEMRGVMIQVRFVPLTDDAGHVAGGIGVGTDVTERIRAEDALRHQAVHDPLTGLPNRTLLRDRMEQALRIRERDGATLARILIDLNGFKIVNDSVGHHHGDLLLRHVASVLRRVMRPTDTVARLGGDEFAVLLPDTDADTAVTLVQTFATVLHAPITLDDPTVRTTASVGIALAPAHGDDVSTLMRHADIAMYTAKRARQGYCIYTGAEADDEAERLALIADLHRALRTQALTLVYQPIIGCADHRLWGVEALVRWSHPTRGPIPPDVFIPLAEESGMITTLSAWVLGEAIRQCGTWRAAGIMASVAVNLSMWDLQDATLVTQVSALLARHGVPPSALHLELTESTVMRDVRRTVAVLTELRDHEIAVAIDDFGTGYSSFAYLKQLPAKTLKIDKMFVRELGHETADAAIVRAAIEMAHSLGMVVVAEGVEDAATLTLLRAMGCDLAQGYFISRPVPLADFTQWVQTWPQSRDLSLYLPGR